MSSSINFNIKIELTLLAIVFLLVFIFLTPGQVNALQVETEPDLVINYRVASSLENNWLGINEIKELDLTDDSVIPVPDLEQIPLLDKDLFYKQANVYYTEFRFKNWKFNFFNQSRTNIVGSTDLIKLIKHVKNNTGGNNNLAIGYARNEIEYVGQGVNYSQDIKLKNNKQVKLGITIKNLEGIEYYKENFSGKALPKSDESKGTNNYVYNLYGEAEIYKQTKHTTSSGYGLDCKTKFIINPNLYLQLEMNNLASEINWSNLEHQIGQISTNNITRNAEGNINYNATMKGREEIINLEQNLPQEANLSLYFQHKGITLYPQIQWAEWEKNNRDNNDYLTSSLKIIYSVSKANRYYLQGFGHNNHLTLGMIYKNFTLDVNSDHYQLRKMKSLGITIGINVQF